MPRVQTTTKRPWQESAPDEPDAACIYANVFDARNESLFRSRFNISWEAFDCEDDFPYTAPVNRFEPNNWKLHDMLGNVWEWAQDCYAESYNVDPDDGSPYEPDKCEYRVLRGGSWNYGPRYLRSANRYGYRPGLRYFINGFRLARTL